MVENVRVSLVNCGAREAIIGEKLLGSEYSVKLSVLGKFRNPLLDRLARESDGNYHIIDTNDGRNFSEVVGKCAGSDFVFIGNETPVIKGLGNMLRKKKIPVIGPDSEFVLEGSKYKTRTFLEETYPKANIEFHYIDPSKAGWETEAKKAVKSMDGKVAIKPIEPKYGKGVVVEGDHFPSARAYEAALDAASSGPFLIEQKINGQEWSGQYLCDRNLHIEAFPAVRDFKRAMENDKGKNIGGFASVSDSSEILPFMKIKEFDEGKKIAKAIVKKLAQTDCYDDGSQTGILYPAFVLPGKGMKIFEINNRLGDPEAMNALAVLENDLVDVCFGMLHGRLPRLEFRKEAVTTIYAAPLTYGGYMKKYTGSKTIKWDEKQFSHDTRIYPASIDMQDGGEMQIMESRSVAVVSRAPTLREALKTANDNVRKIDGPVRYRTDIDMNYMAKCENHMRVLRNQARS